MDNKELYQQYISISEKISELESQKKVIQEQVMQKMTDEQIDKVEADNGLIKLAERPRWTYSENVEKKTGELKELKKVEENTGIAKKEITKYLRVSLR